MNTSLIRTFGVVAGLLVSGLGAFSADVLDAAGLEAAKRLFDPGTIGIELRLQGEYVGGEGAAKVGVQVVARGDRMFHALVLQGGLPGEGWDGGRYALLESGVLEGERVEFRSVGDDGPTATLDLKGLTLKRSGGDLLLRRVERKSATLGMEPPKGAVVLFGGGRNGTEAFEARKDIEGMTAPTMYGEHMMAGAVTKQRFKDLTLHVEFLTGWEPENIPWRRADAGIYLMSRYEVAIGDSFGFDFDLTGSAGPVSPKLFCEKLKASRFPVLTGARLQGAPRVCGSVFTYPSMVPNACLPPLVWQTFDIDFTAPRFGADGKKQSDAVISVRLNGHQTVEKQSVARPTPHGFKGPEEADGPIWFEAFGRRVLYRNIWALER
jgi:hypothetical protein